MHLVHHHIISMHLMFLLSHFYTFGVSTILHYCSWCFLLSQSYAFGVSVGRQLVGGNNSSCSLRQLTGANFGKHLEISEQDEYIIFILQENV